MIGAPCRLSGLFGCLRYWFGSFLPTTGMCEQVLCGSVGDGLRLAALPERYTRECIHQGGEG